MEDITMLLEQAATGEKAQESQLYSLIHEELHRLARFAMRSERSGHTLQPTALVNEAYLRLVGAGPISWDSRGHFFHAAAQVMRRVLIDHARARHTLKRESFKVALHDDLIATVPGGEDLFAINEALDRLHTLSPRCAKVVELRFFAGLSIDETADLMALSPKTVKRETQFARAWLEQQLQIGAGLP